MTITGDIMWGAVYSQALDTYSSNEKQISETAHALTTQVHTLSATTYALGVVAGVRAALEHTQGHITADAEAHEEWAIQVRQVASDRLKRKLERVEK